MSNHSFALLAYNDSAYLSQCLASLRNQTLESEVYISTSTPSPYIYDVAKEFKVKVFVTEKGKGIAHDWNFALTQAKTKYVTLAHQDDIYLSDYTKKCVKEAEKFNDTLICFTNYSELVNGIERNNTLLLAVKKLMLFCFMPFQKYIASKSWKKRSLAFGNYISCPTVMYNLENLKEFRFSHKYKINLDWDAWYRMAEMPGRFVFVQDLLVKHRIHGASATSAGLVGSFRQVEDKVMFNRFWPALPAKVLAKLYSKSYESNKLP